MRTAATRLALALILLALLVAASITVPPMLLRDEAASARIAPYVADARASLASNVDWLPLPLHLRYAGARCRSDGGAVLVFEQWQPPWLSFSYGYTLSGQWPPDGWGGGSGWSDLTDDPEIAAFLGGGEVPCN